MKPDLIATYHNSHDSAAALDDEKLAAAEKLASEALPGQWRARADTVTRWSGELVAVVEHEPTRRFVVESCRLVPALIRSHRFVERCLDSARGHVASLRAELAREREQHAGHVARNQAGERGPVEGIERVVRSLIASVELSTLEGRRRDWSPERLSEQIREQLIAWVDGEDVGARPFLTESCVRDLERRADEQRRLRADVEADRERTIAALRKALVEAQDGAEPIRKAARR